MNTDYLEVTNIYLDRILYNEVSGKYTFPYKNITGWRGSANIEGDIHTGEFSLNEEYSNIEGKVYAINWADYIPELATEINRMEELKRK